MYIPVSSMNFFVYLCGRIYAVAIFFPHMIPTPPQLAVIVLLFFISCCYQHPFFGNLFKRIEFQAFNCYFFKCHFHILLIVFFLELQTVNIHCLHFYYILL